MTIKRHNLSKEDELFLSKMNKEAQDICKMLGICTNCGGDDCDCDEQAPKVHSPSGKRSSKESF